MKKVYQIINGLGEIKDFSNHNAATIDEANTYFLTSLMTDARPVATYDNEADALTALKGLRCSLELKHGIYYGELNACQAVTLDDDGDEIEWGDPELADF